ncbi:MAG: hypothetical protein D3911_07240 [Candidatus Electrothrix sp. AW3_4]|nr:hypothetical protein [Candidatus Electrothrix gigas]
MKILKQITKNPFDILSLLLFKRKWPLFTAMSQRLILQNDSIWQFCTPKSASTFLTKILEELWKEECITGSPVSYWGQRVQEPDIFNIANCLSFYRKNKRYFSRHLHTKNTDFLRFKILGTHAKVIVQTRDLKDTCVSFKDHMDRGEVFNPMIVSASSYWSQLTDDEKYLLIARAYVPWHMDFLKSWELYPNRISIEFSPVVTDTLSVVKDICEYVGIEKSKEEIQRALDIVNKKKNKETRKNVGIEGRGKKCLPQQIVDYIDEMEEFWNKTLDSSKLNSVDYNRAI